jgi:hypothetical protein
VPRVELELVPDGDANALAAARLAAAATDETAKRGSWWSAGVEEAIATREGLARDVDRSPGAARYAAPSPRRTRGATRA